MTALAERHDRFAALHRSGCFVIPNPWDAGSARMMAAAGAEALATTSSGFAFTLGRPDMGRVTRDEALAHAETLLAATPLPVSGDFENGFADDPEEVARTVKLAAEVGLSGCSVEDTRMIEGNPAYAFDLAVERVRAAAAAVRDVGRPFVFCARADGVMNGSYDLDEAIRRVQAFEDAGADLLYVPALSGADDLKRILAAVSAPVNALAAGPLRKLTVHEFATRGVRRISVGGGIARVTQAAIRDCVQEMFGPGSFSCLGAAAREAEINAMLMAGADERSETA